MIANQKLTRSTQLTGLSKLDVKTTAINKKLYSTVLKT